MQKLVRNLSLISLGPIEPSYYQFANVYAELHSFAQKIKEVEKQINNFKEQDDETIDYVKRQLRPRVNDLFNKLKEIEKSIKAYIALVEFRDTAFEAPTKFIRSESLKRMNKTKLTTIDPLIEKIPETFEEEKDCLNKKFKDLQSRVLEIESNVQEEVKVEDKVDYNKRIDELFDLLKRQKKSFEDLDEKMKNQLNEAKMQLFKNTKEEIDKLKDSIFKKLKEMPKSEAGAPDESSLKGMKDNISMLIEKNKDYNERLAKLEQDLKAEVEDLDRLMRSLDSKANKSDLKQIDKDLNKLTEKFQML